MRFTTLLGLSAAAAPALAASTASLYVTNDCSESVYVVYATDASGSYVQGQKTLTTGTGFQVILAGLGYSVGFSTDSNYYATTTPKLIMGYSVNSDDSLLYYSITTDVGNPFASQSWSLTSDNDACTSVSSPNGVTYACPAGSFLFFNLCG
ncbi:uncharacterized protein N0V89_007898 [Didymosphaeria variabile]|uniref:Uncharacterized protein n=1 Tax=Didymosphaeria variabile TaxID=1932322 RepID=A0A9W8XK01_9PLEO|nr:uncharacterized protein N0V89_007898 [Didymosphaeria variabile]KAJ4352549.1 hypothetical protein N0V89_007898 [Didymosphaeria variabile]